MKIVSIDIETTGLDPASCNILEVGAVIDDLSKPFDEAFMYATRFHTYVLPPDYDGTVGSGLYVGQSYALQMNAEILRKIAKEAQPGRYLRPTRVADEFNSWAAVKGAITIADPNKPDKKTIIAAGKNFAGFDQPFLKGNIRDWGSTYRFHHRTIDPVTMYARPDDVLPPDLKQCNERAALLLTQRDRSELTHQFKGEVAHTAVEDAIQVCKLIRAYYNIL